jgi:DNA-directed RNA polymerase subunit RPC12/RpoP
MIVRKTLDHVTKDGREIFKYSFNDTFWRDNSSKGISVVLDEAHTLVDSRRAMSKINGIMNDFIALLRRILGDSGDGYGELILITQLGRRLDVNARELATSVHYHISHYVKTCMKCNFKFKESNEQNNKPTNCPKCNGFRFKKSNFVIEKFEFPSMEHCDAWIETRRKTYCKHYYITDIEKYFSYYDTFQWENLITDED